MSDEPQLGASAPLNAQPASGGKPAAPKAPPAKSKKKSGAKSSAKAETGRRQRQTTTAMQGSVSEAPFDPQLMERELLELTRLLEEQDFETEDEMNAFLQQLSAPGALTIRPPATPLDEAQEVIYQAMQATGKRREKLIQEALAISPDCADAYVLQAQMAPDPQQARRLFEEGMRAGERALGDMFAQLEADGEFWSYIMSRPYMRARMGLADALWETGEREESIAHLQEMLRLNLDDNRGLRYVLINRLLAIGDEPSLSATEELLTRFNEEESAVWAYSRLLLRLRREGTLAVPASALAEAMDINPFVPLYLVGAVQLPKEPPEAYGFGDENEAAAYLYEGGAEAWLYNQQDILWLAEALMTLLPADLEEDAERTNTPRRPRKRK